MLLFPVTREGNICMYQDIDPVKLKTRGDFRRPCVGNYKRKKKRDSKHPCDQFAQDDIEMREAVLEHLVM